MTPQEVKAITKRLDKLVAALVESNMLTRTMILVNTASLPHGQADVVLKALGMIE